MDEMTFVEEEEIFPSLGAHDVSGEEQVKETSDSADAKPNGKRKLPEISSEKKVLLPFF